MDNNIPSPSEAEKALKSNEKNYADHLAIARSMQQENYPENPIFANCKNDPRARGAESNMDIITSEN